MKAQRRVIVCGAGLAGFSAAVTALQCGAHVTLIEKSAAPGGTTVISGGLLWTFEKYEEARAKIPFGDAALQWLVFDTIDDSRQWLQSFGATLGPLETFLEHGRGQSSDPVQLIQLLGAQFASLGGVLRTNCALDTLMLDGNSVVGVRAIHRGVLEEIHADSVVLATGGFQGNAELLSRYVARPENLLLRANPWSTGDGFLAATAAGAAASPGLDAFYGHAMPPPPARFSPIEFRDISQYYGPHAVAINLLGERFGDECEATGEEALNQWLARQPKGQGFYVIDAGLLEVKPLQGRDAITRSIIERTRKTGATIVDANSLADLCQGLAQFGVPPARALRTLEEFNQRTKDGTAGELVPARSRRRLPLAEPPFTAVLVQSAITFTTGGLLVDERLRVLRRSASTSALAAVPASRAFVDSEEAELSIGDEYRSVPIRGLYAAGGDAGNISHFGYMGGLATALTTGRASGREASR